jgi:DNA-binding CsgD family transcriptional regulator
MTLYTFRNIVGRAAMPDIAEVIGRDAELASISEFLDAAARGCGALLLEGEPGIGKTTVWSAALETARSRSCTVLATRCGQPEAALSFSGLADLLEPVLDAVLPRLPPPQARALEIALVRIDPADAALDQRAVLLGFLGAVRQLAGSAPVVLAIDDAQWLDAATAGAVAFAFRRLESAPVAVLASVRASRDGTPTLDLLDLSGGRPGPRLRRLAIGPLSLGAISRVLREQAGVTPSRSLVRRIYETSGGNPLYALELARALERLGGEPAADQPLPVPTGLAQMVQARLAGLDEATRELLLLAAAAHYPSVALLAEASEGRRVIQLLQPAVDLGIAEIRPDGSLRFGHPLWASAAYSAAPLDKRQRAHERLAASSADPEARARHLALAAERPSEEVAAALNAAAARARGRGAAHLAAEHAALAARLTPEGEQRWRRRIAAAEYLFHSGDALTAARQLEEIVADLEPGPVRAQARLELGQIRTYDASNEAAIAVLEPALDDASDSPLLQAEIHLTMAWICNFDISEGIRHADAAAALLDPDDQPSLLAGALGAKMWLEFLAGNGLALELAERATALERKVRAVRAVDGADLPLGALLKSADRLDESRARLEKVLSAATLEQDDSSRFEVVLELGHLECLAGRWQLAERYARETAEIIELTGQDELRPAAGALEALVAALLGRLESARATATAGLSAAEASRSLWFTLMSLPVLGFIELSAGRPAEAVRYLARADEICERIGLAEPGRFRFLADYVEALIATGELDLADEVLGRLEQRGRALGRQWALATAARCRMLLLAAAGQQDGALAQLEISLRHHEGLPMPFEHARTLLAGGTVHRRARRKRDSRQMLEAALSAFETLGAVVWAEQASAGLARTGLRPPEPLDLTPTERRVAEMAAAGRTNREIAEGLFISLRTAESTLSRVYRKLGIRSRAELARDFAAGGPRH